MEIVNGERLVLGTCYYPEHWDESLWRDDLRRMLENGIEVIRIAEFAWSKIERYEGVFNYDFFDRFLDAAAEISPKRIVYVSCDPATLARDVKYLGEKGYRFVEGTPVDMFPWGVHCEVVTKLEKI